MFKKTKLLLLSMVAVGAIGLVGCSKKEAATKDQIKVALVLDEGGVNDQSFNQSAWEGALEAQDKYDVKVTYLESKQESDYLTNLEIAVDNGSDLIIGVGFKMSDAVKEAATAYPEQKFAIVDGTYDDIPKNIIPILFNEEEAGYSVGLVAGKVTKTNKLGFIGGMEIPSVSNFALGFEKGLKEANPDAQLNIQYANSFTDAAKGRAISQQMINSNVDIIFTAGGGVNNGVYEASKELGIKAVGVDMPCNYISPDVILTSALKNVGVGVEIIIEDFAKGVFIGGQPRIFDLLNDGVGYEKTDLIPNDVIEYVDSKIK